MGERNTPWIHLIVVALAISLGGGAGLPGFAAALAPTTNHVCTCASGGSHAACAVCNPLLRDDVSHRSRDRGVQGVPCGDRRSAVGGLSDSGTLPAPYARSFAGSERANAAWAVTVRPDFESVEPATPPPRFHGV